MYPTRKQKIILDTVQQYIAENGRAPTLQEIARRCRLSSLATVHRHLALLQERGLLRRRKSRRRGIELKPAAQSALAVAVPLAGNISAGRPIEAVQQGEVIEIPREMARHPRTFALRVRGHSMRDEQIHDGDLMVLEEREEARDGDVVVALIDGGDATLKTFKKERGRVRLQPTNPSVAPIYFRPADLRIQGVVTGLIRVYDRG